MKENFKIGIDISRSVEQTTGVGYYAKNLVKGLSEIDTGNEYLLYGMFYECYPKGWETAVIPDKGHFRLHHRHLPFRMAARKWKNCAIDGKSAHGAVDLIHSTAFTVPPLSGPSLVVTIHDLSCYALPECHTKDNYDFVNKNLHLAARKADFIIVDSESTKKELKRYLHIPDERIGVVYLAAGDVFSKKCSADKLQEVKVRYGLSVPYLLALGSIEPRKNLERTIQAFDLLVKSGFSDHKLVVVGGSGWKNDFFHETIKRLGIKEHIILTGYVSEQDLPAIYQGAEMLVYPSIYEGFGLPVLEAMASGVPVITSNCSSLTEVAGDAASLVNPFSVEEIYKGMTLLLRRSDIKSEMVHKGLEQCRRFSWEKTAQRTLSIYEHIIEKKQTPIEAS